MLADQLLTDFQKAEEENNRYSILNFIYFIKAKFIRINLLYAGYVYRSIVDTVLDDGILLTTHGFQESTERKVTITFEALNRYYLFESVITGYSEQGILIRIPDSLRFLARRKHPRLKFDDLFMRFIILYSPIFESRQAEKAMQGRLPNFYSEILKDSPSHQIVYQMLNSEVARVSREFEFKLFSETPEEELTIPERILKESNRSIFISDTANLKSYTEPLPSESVINYSQYFEDLKEKTSEIEALKELEAIKKKDMRQFLVSYLMLPISLFGTPIGYVNIETNQFDKRFIALQQAEEIGIAAELYSYAITKIHIRNSHFDPSSVQTRIVNISLSGLLIELTDEVLYNYLQSHRRIKMLIPIQTHEIEVFGEIVRNFEKNNFYYLGVSFFLFNPGDIIFLENFVYENLHYQFF